MSGLPNVRNRFLTNYYRKRFLTVALFLTFFRPDEMAFAVHVNVKHGRFLGLNWRHFSKIGAARAWRKRSTPDCQTIIAPLYSVTPFPIGALCSPLPQRDVTNLLVDILGRETCLNELVNSVVPLDTGAS